MYRIQEQALKQEKLMKPKEKMEGPASPWGLRNRHDALPFRVNDDNDDDDYDDNDFLKFVVFF
jgi:hypothetical protein